MNINSSLSHRGEEPEKSVLYMVGTPIGNFNDISKRALNILKNVSLIACEDTRQTKKLMNKYEIKNKLVSFNKLNGFEKISELLMILKMGNPLRLLAMQECLGFVIQEELVKNARLNKIDVICIPGACAIITALVASGMPSSSFVFIGFLPKKRKIESKFY